MKPAYIRRYDDDGILRYFDASDFPGLRTAPISFAGGSGDTLRGAIYHYDGADSSSLVILAHGFGGGHRSYMREIERLCRRGYRVLSYDVTGTFSSDGADIGGLCSFPADLVACLRFVGEAYRERLPRLLLFGHSMGGCAVAYALSRFPEISAAVISAGFAEVAGFLPGLRAMGELSSTEEGEAAENACHAGILHYPLADALAATTAEVLCLHSADDPTVPYEKGLSYVSSRVGNPRVTFLTVNGKQHCPHYTADAVAYMGACFAEYAARLADGSLKTVEDRRAFMQTKDFLRMTEQDGEIWEKIFETFERPTGGKKP